ncbi:cobyrinate a,c-diamide synthase [Microcoleus sp. FACHB-1515]|uniref:cobyrinate a,c-diamide synthase n=1 Tax=Cyanophyceae TaxID=3028117 RepID=UPI001689573C|nr:cobyrinate a,c-diamide synthase [Microcoleus sp. FACHB-1515]MBD2092676.1 cobyrinate a,c-diamide synthase [Microcoleus sp. FACHB-1515]
MAIVLAGTSSGVGKTTIAIAMLAYLRQHRVQSFKVGPDYIDPMFHTYVTGRPCRNLDPLLTAPQYLQDCFAHHSFGMEYALVEGVMGLFDGAGGTETASTAQVAKLLNLPVVLVVDCGRLSRSIAAIVHGYRTFDPAVNLAGVILNRVASDRHLEILQSALEPLETPILGVVRRQDDIVIPDRHLGLIPTEELPQLADVIDRLANLARSSFDWSRLLPLLTPIPRSPTSQPSTSQPSSPIRLGIARDRAFNFYYADNLDLLKQQGAELVFWSPIAESLPPNLQGLYLGGGFPEVFAAELAENQAAIDSVRRAIAAGMPTYAECGGLMYLAEAIEDFDGAVWPLVGALPTKAMMSARLTLGYRQAIALQDTVAIAAGQQVWGHEFHRSRLSIQSEQAIYQLESYLSDQPPQFDGWQTRSIHASYVHLHWGASPEIPARFLHSCRQFERDRNG